MVRNFSKVAVIAALAGVLVASAVPIASANDWHDGARIAGNGGAHVTVRGRGYARGGYGHENGGGALVAGGVIAGAAAAALTAGVIASQQPAYYGPGYSPAYYGPGYQTAYYAAGVQPGYYPACDPYGCPPPRHCHRQRLFDQYGHLVAVRRVCR